MRFFTLCLAIIASVFLVSCANHSKDYLKKDQQIASIIVPPGVPALKQQMYYPVPTTAQNATVKSVSLVPPTMKTGEVPKRS